jgi:DNA-binding IclR family transcriptional regulator
MNFRQPDKAPRVGADELGQTRHRSSMASRVMSVLGAFSVEQPQLRAAEIARLSGLPSATADRLLKELVTLGALERLATGRYAVGPRLWEIGVLGSEAYRIWGEARPHLESLARDTGRRAHLGLLSGLEGLRLEATSSHAATTAPCWVVERLPLHATAVGHILLAFGRPELLGQVLRRPLVKYTPQTIASRSQLSEALDVVRRTSVAVCRNQYQPGRSSIAAPVLDVDGHAVGAVELELDHAPESRQLRHAVMRSSSEVSRNMAIGFRHDRSRIDHFSQPVGNRSWRP